MISTCVRVEAFSSRARSSCQFPSPINMPATNAIANPAAMRSCSLIRFVLATFDHTVIALVETAHQKEHCGKQDDHGY